MLSASAYPLERRERLLGDVLSHYGVAGVDGTDGAGEVLRSAVFEDVALSACLYTLEDVSVVRVDGKDQDAGSGQQGQDLA